MDKKGLNKESFAQFVKFALVGCSNTVVSYVVYAVLVYFGMHYLVANVFSYFAGVVNSFIWNSKFVFELEDTSALGRLKAFGKMLASNALTGLVINNLLLILWVDKLGISQYLGPILNLCVTMPLNFVLTKFWAFRKKEA